MKHINNETDFVVILSKKEIENLMYCCNSARIRWHELWKMDKDETWETMINMADDLWESLYKIKNPGKEV